MHSSGNKTKKTKYAKVKMPDSSRELSGTWEADKKWRAHETKGTLTSKKETMCAESGTLHINLWKVRWYVSPVHHCGSYVHKSSKKKKILEIEKLRQAQYIDTLMRKLAVVLTEKNGSASFSKGLLGGTFSLSATTQNQALYTGTMKRHYTL